MPINGYFDTVFAIAGDKVTVPDPVQGGGTVSYDQGYPIGYSTPVASGGILITRTSMNQLFYDITAALQQYQQHSTAPFITSTMNGGTPYSYSKYDRVLYSGVLYQSLSNSNTDTPPSANWAVADVNVNNVFVGGITTGSANAQAVATVSPAASSFSNGQAVICTAGFTNTGGMTFNAGGEGNLTVKKDSGSGLVVLTGGEVTTGNTVIFTRNTAGSCWVLTEGFPLGSAAYKAASDTSKSAVASVSGSITAGHLATFADTSGTVQDGGATSQFAPALMTPLAVGSVISAYKTSGGNPVAGTSVAAASITPCSFGGASTGDSITGTWNPLTSAAGTGSTFPIMWQRIA